MRSRAPALLLAVLWAAHGVSAQTPFQMQSPPIRTDHLHRPLQVTDLLKIEEFRDIDLSPDGRTATFVVSTPCDSNCQQWDHRWLFAPNTVWQAQLGGDSPRKIIEGRAAGESWYGLQWSPSHDTLAALVRTLRDNNSLLWIWDPKTGARSRLTSRGVEYFQWLDSRRLLCWVLPEGEQPRWATSSTTRAPRLAETEWAKAAAGAQATASVLRSGVPADLSKKPQGQLLLIDAQRSESRLLVETNIGYEFQISPDKQSVAYLREAGLVAPQADEPVRVSDRGKRYSLDVVDLEGYQLLSSDQFSLDVLPGSVRWSPEGTELAFFAGAESRDAVPRLYRARLGTRGTKPRIDRVEMKTLDGDVRKPVVAWAPNGQLLLFAARRSATKKPLFVKARRDWWLIKPNGSVSNLTASLRFVPETLTRLSDGRAFFGVADGEVWRIGLDFNIRNLTQKLEPRVTGIAWQDSRDELRAHASRIILETNMVSRTVAAQPAQPQKAYYALDVESGASTRVAMPTPDAELRSYSAQTGSALYSMRDRHVDILAQTVGEGHSQELMRVNEFMRDLAEGQFKHIQYTSLDGEPLNGSILLPMNYEPGKRYPLLTWIYPGRVENKIPEEGPAGFHNFHEETVWNMALAAARGYAVLFPSIPLNPDTEVDEILLKVTGGVLPAVERAIAEGVADPDRLFVAGHSAGGFATNGTIMQTSRFKAAIAMAGMSDPLSFHGTIDPDTRFAAPIFDELTVGRTWWPWLESTDGHMRNPPWKDLGRYLRNSPVTIGNRIQTPLLLIHGDIDNVLLQQAEEMFVFLYRQGKRAELVRYWGEGHFVHSPSNIRDAWSRIFTWFDDFGDISRDDSGNLVFDGDHVKSRDGAGVHFKPADWLSLWERERGAHELSSAATIAH